MYWTQNGERILGQHEGQVFKEMCHQLLVWMDPRDEENQHDDEMNEYGIAAFDSMSYGQKLWALHRVVKALFDENEPAPTLVAYLEATVSAVFTQADILLDLEKHAEHIEHLIPFRSMLVNAVKELDEEFDERDVEEFGYKFLAETLQDTILWDLDFMDESPILDGPPGYKDNRNVDDYHTAIADDPKDSELRPLYNQILGLLGDEGLPIQKIKFTVTWSASADGLGVVESRDGRFFVTDGKSFLSPDIDFWTNGSPDFIEDEIWASNWPYGALKPVSVIDSVVKIRKGILHATVTYTAHVDACRTELVQTQNGKAYLRYGFTTALVYPSLSWMKAENDDIESGTASGATFHDALFCHLVESTQSESADIVIEKTNEPTAAGAYD